MQYLFNLFKNLINDPEEESSWIFTRFSSSFFDFTFLPICYSVVKICKFSHFQNSLEITWKPEQVEFCMKNISKIAHSYSDKLLLRLTSILHDLIPGRISAKLSKDWHEMKAGSVQFPVVLHQSTKFHLKWVKNLRNNC